MRDKQLYERIVQHRAKYTAIRGIDYSNHAPHKLNFLPPDEVQATWERDYGLMLRAMIYGNPLSYAALMKRLEELKQRFRNLYWE